MTRYQSPPGWNPERRPDFDTIAILTYDKDRRVVDHQYVSVEGKAFVSAMVSAACRAIQALAVPGAIVTRCHVWSAHMYSPIATVNLEESYDRDYRPIVSAMKATVADPTNPVATLR